MIGGGEAEWLRCGILDAPEGSFLHREVGLDVLVGGGRVFVALPDETLPAFLGAGSPTVAPRPHDAESLPGDLRETATVRAAVAALHEAVGMADAGCRKDAAAAAWHAEPVLRLFCSAFGCAIAGMRVSEGGFIVVTAEPSAADAVEASITVGPEGTCACTVSAGDMHLASTAPDVQSFERAVRERLAEAGVLDSGQ